MTWPPRSPGSWIENQHGLFQIGNVLPGHARRAAVAFVTAEMTLHALPSRGGSLGNLGARWIGLLADVGPGLLGKEPGQGLHFVTAERGHELFHDRTGAAPGLKVLHLDVKVKKVLPGQDRDLGIGGGAVRPMAGETGSQRFPDRRVLVLRRPGLPHNDRA